MYTGLSLQPLTFKVVNPNFPLKGIPVFKPIVFSCVSTPFALVHLSCRFLFYFFHLLYIVLTYSAAIVNSNIGLCPHWGLRYKFQIYLSVWEETYANSGRTYKLHGNVVLGHIRTQDPSCKATVLTTKPLCCPFV